MARRVEFPPLEFFDWVASSSAIGVVWKSGKKRGSLCYGNSSVVRLVEAELGNCLELLT